MPNLNWKNVISKVNNLTFGSKLSHIKKITFIYESPRIVRTEVNFVYENGIEREYDIRNNMRKH